MGRYIELGRKAAILTIADELTIHPEMECRVDSIKAQEDLPAAPGRRDTEPGSVAPGRIIIMRYYQRIAQNL